MNPPETRILEFIKEHHILNLAVVRDNIPWCATCYYVYRVEENRFIFTSEPHTRHVRDVIEGGQYQAAGTIALETRIIGKIRGLQFSGTIRPVDESYAVMARKAYLRRFPVARLMPGLHLWTLEPDYIKMTDNRLGFGKKLIWTPGSPETLI